MQRLDAHHTAGSAPLAANMWRGMVDCNAARTPVCFCGSTPNTDDIGRGAALIPQSAAAMRFLAVLEKVIKGAAD